MNKRSGWLTAAAVIAVLAAMAFVFIYLKDCELYIGGVILSNVHTLVGIVFEILVLIIVIPVSVTNLKKAGDEKERRRIKISIIGVSAFLLIMLVFVSRIVAGYAERSRKAAIAEIDIGEGQSILLVENEEQFSLSEDSFFEITLYCREGLRLKKIGRQTEYYYAHNNMVRNGQYKVERVGDTVKVYYDYGELINGLKWKDEYINDPPEYIEKEYRLDK